MNSSIAKQRLSEVIRVDTITSSYGDFLATHVQFKKIQLQKKYDPNTFNDRSYTEEQIYKSIVLNPKNQHQVALVIGSSGAGKSHLIRWFDAKLEKIKSENEVVLFVRRSDNSLKGTIKQLLEKPEVANISNKDVYERLVKATSSIDEKKLKDMIYQYFIVEIKNDNGDDDISLSNVERKRLVALLQNDTFQERLMQNKGAIERIYSKVAENKTTDNRDAVAEFYPEDFQVDISFCDELNRNEADLKARKMADKLYAETELAQEVAGYLNSMVDIVIQRCAGLEPGDFEQVFLEIRKELKKQGKNLTLLVEDITAFTGVNEALLNVLIPHTGDYEKDNICRISAIIGTTTEYFKSNFRDNQKDRVTHFVIIPDDVFGADENDLCEFVGRYLNVMSLDKEEVDIWANEGADSDSYPVHKIVEGEGWDSVLSSDGKVLNLYPFSKRAIVYLYNTILQENYRTPRYLLRDVVEKTVRDALWNIVNFPGFKIQNTNTNADLRDRLRAQNVSSELFERLYLFMCVWGDASTEEYKNGEITYVAGLPLKVYEDLGLPIISGKKVIVKGEYLNKQTELIPQQQNSIVKTPAEIAAEKKMQSERAQLNDSLQVIENWIAGGTLNVGATTGNVVLISKAREDMCNYLYSAIDWQAEGVSMDNIDKIKKVKERLVGFDRQKRGEDAMFYKLPADRETQGVVEAFLEWNVLGKRSWNFDGADRRVYRVQLWTEKIKKPLIKAITTFENHDIDYFKCAMTAEFYRIILFGLCKATTLDGLKSEHILENGIRNIGINSHSEAWNTLLGLLVRGENDRINRDTVIQYTNIIQGESHAQVFLNRVDFDAMVREVKNDRLTVDSNVLDLIDPVKSRRDSREYLKSILERIEKVQEDELKKATKITDLLKVNFNTVDIDDEDIQDIVEKIVEFYDVAEKNKISIKYEQNLFDEVKKYAKSTSIAIQEIIKAQKATNPLDSIMAFSQDPIRKVERLQQLLEKVTADIDKVKSEISVKKAKLGGDTVGGKTDNKFVEEKDILNKCSIILKGMEV